MTLSGTPSAMSRLTVVWRETWNARRSSPALVEETVPDAQDVARIKGGADGGDKHEARVRPTISGGGTLEVLLVAMHPQRLD